MPFMLCLKQTDFFQLSVMNKANLKLSSGTCMVITAVEEMSAQLVGAKGSKSTKTYIVCCCPNGKKGDRII